MAFHQVKEIIKETCKNHRKVAEFYDYMSDHVEGDKVKMLLKNMKDHEDKISNGISLYLKDGSKTLDSWFQYLPSLPHVKDLISQELPEDATEDDVLHLFDEISTCFAVRYAKLSEVASSEAVHDLFIHMKDLEEYELTRESWIKTMMDDM